MFAIALGVILTWYLLSRLSMDTLLQVLAKTGHSRINRQRFTLSNFSGYIATPLKFIVVNGNSDFCVFWVASSSREAKCTSPGFRLYIRRDDFSIPTDRFLFQCAAGSRERSVGQAKLHCIILPSRMP
ncbi:MAG: hypothetical protein ABFC57_08955 [Veillonellales bacterium]